MIIDDNLMTSGLSKWQGMQVFKKLLIWTSLLSTGLGTSYADFINGDFSPDLSGWTATGYLFSGYAAGLTLPPKSLADITLTPSTSLAQGITDVFTGTTQTFYDYFLVGVSPATTLLLPESNNSSAIINLRSQTNPKAVSGNASKPTGWAKYPSQATSLSQTIRIQSADIQAGIVTIHFKLAAVMENPAHTAKQQPFYAIQVNNLTTGRTGANPLYFQWSYAGQSGVPWNTIPVKGTNSGSNATYTYVDWQNYALSFNSSEVHLNDDVELVVIAAGCSPGGHDGHIYLDSVTTQQPTSGLSILTSTNSSSVQAGQQIVYTYTFSNNNLSAAANSVVITAYMPQTQNTAVPYDTVFSQVSATTTAGGSCAYNLANNNVVCSGFNLAPGQTGTFTMTVNVPGDWQPSYGPINNGNFPIQATGINPVLGNLVQTPIVADPNPPALNSFLVVDVAGLQINNQNLNLHTGDTYTGSYTCTNTGTATASPASCDINNLPLGLSVTGCTKSGFAWTTPYSIEIGATVICTVAGTVTETLSTQYDAQISSEAANNTNSQTNHATVPYYIFNNPVKIPATLNGSTVISPAKICCGRPVVVYDLPIVSDLPATYEIISITGNIQCSIGQNALNSFVKMHGRPGSCTIIAHKDNQISEPLVLVAI